MSPVAWSPTLSRVNLHTIPVRGHYSPLVSAARVKSLTGLLLRSLDDSPCSGDNTEANLRSLLMGLADTTSAGDRMGRWCRPRRIAFAAAAALGVYLLVAYVAVPMIWRSYFRHHPGLDDAPDVTETKDGIPRDPVNVALAGAELQ